MLIYARKTWTLTQENKRVLAVQEKTERFQGNFYIIEWRVKIRTNIEIYTLYNEPELVICIKIGKWFGHVIRVKNQWIPSKMLNNKPGGRRRSIRRFRMLRMI